MRRQRAQPAAAAARSRPDEDVRRPVLRRAGIAAGPATRPAAAEQVQGQLSELQVMVRSVPPRPPAAAHDLPEELFRLFTDLLDSDLSEDLARELVERVRGESRGARGSTTCCWSRPASRG